MILIGCWWPGCPRSTRKRRRNSRGLCRHHYQIAYRAGRIRTGLIDAAPALVGINRFTARGRSLRTLADLTGEDHRTLSDLAARRIVRTQPRVIEAVLTVALPPSDVGCVRRVQALMALGHTVTGIAEGIGTKPSALRQAMVRDRFSDRLALALAPVYERWSVTSGTSGRSIARGAALGYAPPAAWEYIDIDDTTAVPDLGPDIVVTVADKVAEVQHLLRLGETRGDACKQVGWAPETYRQATRRQTNTARTAA